VDAVAAGFVASDAVGRLWGRTLELRGVAGLADQATEQLVRWESPYGWTRSGWGKVSERTGPAAWPSGTGCCSSG